MRPASWSSTSRRPRRLGLTVPSVVKLGEEENHGEDLALPVGAMSTRYGSETVVLSPLELITKVPDVVSPV